MTQKAILVAGLGFGDEGKGSIVDYLTRTIGAGTIVRYNGGAQAAHNVMTPDGRHHLFAQFGSGTFVPRVRTHLSRFMVVNPIRLLVEEEHLRSVGVIDALQRITVDRDAPIVTPIQKEINRFREIARGDKKHGSCGVGIGETIRDSQQYPDATLYARDLCDPRIIRKKMGALVRAKRLEFAGHRIPCLEEPHAIIERCVEHYSYFTQHVQIVDGQSHLAHIMRENKNVIFEGAQGMLLDVNYGFIPYHTKTDISFANAFTLLHEADYRDGIERVGVLRGYHTRHGPGPFPTEDTALFDAFKDEHNAVNDWQGNFRVGHFDAVLGRYARNVIGGVDYLAITSVDRMRKLSEIRLCNQYVSTLHDEAFFAYKDDDVVDIRMTPYGTDHQKLLTRHMEAVRPVYESLPAVDSRVGMCAYLYRMEEVMSTPVRIVSFGPTAKDKIKI